MNGKLTKDHQKSLLETLKDPKEAAAYLNAAPEEGDNEFNVKQRILLCFYLC